MKKTITTQLQLFPDVPDGYEVIYRKCVRKRNGKGWICAKPGKFLRLVVRKRKP
jgi:hypothetical protein